MADQQSQSGSQIRRLLDDISAEVDGQDERTEERTVEQVLDLLNSKDSALVVIIELMKRYRFDLEGVLKQVDHGMSTGLEFPATILSPLHLLAIILLLKIIAVRTNKNVFFKSEVWRRL